MKIKINARIFLFTFLLVCSTTTIVCAQEDTIGVFRPSEGKWYLNYNLDGTTDKTVQFGMSGDNPVVGDYNRDGTTDIGVFRSGEWILDYGIDGTVNRRFNWGLSTDKPVVGDFNNDGTMDIGVYRSGQWILDYGITGNVDLRVNYGSATDIPVVGKWAALAGIAVNVLSVKSGDEEYAGDAILNTAVVQKAMNYNPINIDGYASNALGQIKTLLPTTKILLINGHAAPGLIQINKQNDEWYYGKKLLPWEYEFNEISSYANMNLAIFMGCNSGNLDFTHGNLVDIIGDKNGRCAMGWTKVLSSYLVPYYNTQLWNQIQQSKTIMESHEIAKTAVKNDGLCQDFHQRMPDVYNEYCNQDALYYRQNNQGCGLALPNGMASQISSIPVQTKNIQPSASIIAITTESIQRFTNSMVKDVYYTGIIHESYADLYAFDSNHSFYLVNNINNRVQSALWFESGSKDQNEIIDLDQGKAIAESFTREKYPEFWNNSDARSTRLVTKNVLDRGGDRQLQYEWWEIYYSSDKNSISHSEVPGLNSVSVTISPYTGHVVEYSEIYTPSVITGFSPVDLTPALTEEQAKKIAENHFQTLGVSDTELPGSESLGLRISTDYNNTPHLEWNFKMTRNQKNGSKDQEFEVKEYAIVSVDAHDGTIIWSAPFN